MSESEQAIARLQATAVYEASQELGIPEAELSIVCLNADGKAVRAHLMLSGLSLCHVSAYDVLEASAGLYNLVHSENLPGYLRQEQATKRLASQWLGLPEEAISLSYLPGLTFTSPKWTVYIMVGSEIKAQGSAYTREEALLNMLPAIPLPEEAKSLAMLLSPAIPEAAYQNYPSQAEQRETASSTPESVEATLVARLQAVGSRLYDEEPAEAHKVELISLPDGQWLARLHYPSGDIQEATEGASYSRLEALATLLRALEALEEPEAPYSEAESGACLEATRLASLIWPEAKPFAVKVSQETDEGDSYFTASVDSTSEADCYLDSYTERSRLEALVSLVGMLRLRLPEADYQAEAERQARLLASSPYGNDEYIPQETPESRAELEALREEARQARGYDLFAKQAEHEEAWAEIEQATEQAPHLVEEYQKWYQSWHREPTPQERRLARALFNVSQAEAEQAEEAN